MNPIDSTLILSDEFIARPGEEARNRGCRDLARPFTAIPFGSLRQRAWPWARSEDKRDKLRPLAIGNSVKRAIVADGAGSE